MFRIMFCFVFIGISVWCSQLALANEVPINAEQQCGSLGGQWVRTLGGGYCELAGKSHDYCDTHDGLMYTGVCRIDSSRFVKTIGSRLECVAMGGKWTTRRYGRYDSTTECRKIPMSESDCESYGGDWENGSCTFSASVDYEANDCSIVGGVWDQLNHRCFSNRDRKRCQRTGGNWQPVGRARNYECVHYSEDGGKACSGPSECKLKRCVVLSRPDDTSAPVVGECVKTDSPFGCSWDVVGGYVADGGCVD
jgi:hypothetical protein